MNSQAFISSTSSKERNHELSNVQLYCHKHLQRQPMKFKKLHRQALLKRYDIAYYECSQCNCQKRIFEKPQLFDEKKQNSKLIIEQC